MNSMAYADVAEPDAAMAATLASTVQQLSMSFGLACGSLVAGLYMPSPGPASGQAVCAALHHAFLTLAGLTLVSSLSFWALREHDGDSVSRGARPAAPPP